MPTFDDLRAALPLTGLAVYAFDPGGPLTMELLTPDGRLLAIERATLAECIAAAMPPKPPDPVPAPSIFDFD